MSPTKYHRAIAYILSNQYTNRRNLDHWQLLSLEEDFVNLLSHVDEDFDEKKFSAHIRMYKPRDFAYHIEQKILSTDNQKDKDIECCSIPIVQNGVEMVEIKCRSIPTVQNGVKK